MPSEPAAPVDAKSPAERARRRRLLLATVVLLIGLPIYLYVAASVVAALNPPAIEGGPSGRTLHWAVELVIYVALGLLWAWPLKRLVRGLGRKAD